MKPIHIYFKDPALFTGTKFLLRDIKLNQPRVVEVIGYPVKETDTYLFLAVTIADGVYKVLFDIPKANIIKKDNKDIFETKYLDMRVSYGKFYPDDLDKHKPLEVSIAGFKADEDEDNIYIASEKNEDGKFRTFNVIPKGLIL